MTAPIQREIELEVRYAETDQMGVVHHANYLIWFEQARTSLCTATGYHYADIEKLGYLLMVTGAQLEYRQGARYGDTVRVICWLDRLNSRALRFAYEVRREDELLARGSTEHIWIEAASGRPRRMPEVLREPFTRLAEGGDGG
ncbi:MAG: thioesterase family protein [Thermoanaerobaculia bacterium]